MNLKQLRPLILLCCLVPGWRSQQPALSVGQQRADFVIFKGGLKEGHAGLYYFIDEERFAGKCDSIEKSFVNDASPESFYLKLRYLITLLHHGHTRLQLPAERGPNFKMAVLNRDKQYLPLQIILLGNRLYVLSDCSSEQTVPIGSQLISINGMPVSRLIDSMHQYLPADGINTSFKNYCLYNYYYFHFLYNLLYPSQTAFSLQLDSSKDRTLIKARTPALIEAAYLALNKKAISRFDNPLKYIPDIDNHTAYLKVGSFYKGFIENFGNHFEPFLDSAFTDILNTHAQRLVLDIRNNEGGGDNYIDILFSHISKKSFTGFDFDETPGTSFPYAAYTVNLADDIKTYMSNPRNFLKTDSGLQLKDEVSAEKKLFQPAKTLFTGQLYVIMNGGTFSAANIFVRDLYQYRNETGAPIVFVGEENGGDVYSNVLCAGQSYTIKLPNSGITVDMPFLSQGKLNRVYPSKRLPDELAQQTIQDEINGKDAVLQYVLDRIKHIK